MRTTSGDEVEDLIDVIDRQFWKNDQGQSDRETLEKIKDILTVTRLHRQI